MKKPIQITRRNMLGATAGLIATAALRPATASAQQVASSASTAKPLPSYVSWKNSDSMIIHTPTTIETKRSAIGSSIITPSDRLFIRNNLPAPTAADIGDVNAWKLSIEGVSKPETFSVADLKQMGFETMAAVLQCSGNGRGLFPGNPSGTKWQTGAAGCVMWTGVAVRDVIKALGGVSTGMIYMTGTGGEKLPAGIDPLAVVVERSVPLAAMQDALLAWEMNGEPMPLAHGGPLRLIVPGYSGVNNIKYIKRLAFTKDQTQAAIQKTGYRMSPIGQKGDPTQPAVWTMDAKSWITSPSPDSGPIKAGQVQIKGVALGALEEVAKVDVSLDGGANWQPARLVGPDLGKYAWRQFVLSMNLKAGQYLVSTRVTTKSGVQQVALSTENAAGYLNSSWIYHSVRINVA
ncbi:sulfite oxidase [Polynucleobacter antarcticus]|uniref:Sulfite oxidase n=1 Tax=Polynucleobacter antarcticus TaxID=1743162 RepID=A0A6M9PJY7_9BURK|nr:sulfite oxidase [Polynucleobacter antarcticus]QKM62434.1 sulfite oxidase [Polynucleobacter antarcticus]